MLASGPHSEFFGLSPDFPSGNLLVRNAEHLPLRSVYLTSTTAKAVITGGGPGQGVHPHLNPMRLRLINSGVKAFGRQDSGRDAALRCRWRSISDAVPALRPFIAEERIVVASLPDLAFLLREHYPTLDSVPGDFEQTLKKLEMGSHIMDVLPGQHEQAKLDSKLSLPIWRAAASVNLMLDKKERR